jgi:RimJ/RimL family protein N-acetyltransferase
MAERIDAPSLRMTWSEAPWDSRVCGYPVLQISSIQLTGHDAGRDLKIFERERDRLGAGLVSCRLSHESLRESMLLEDHGFRFIEMLYQPEFDLAGYRSKAEQSTLEISRAREDELDVLRAIARTAFQNERFKMDPRLDPEVSDQRYQTWVASSMHHPTQELYAIRAEDRPVAFFVTEMLDDGTCYWHLNAVASDMQGRGYGKRAWQGMLQFAADAGAKRVQTCIVARNYRVLNLYASLGFRFPPPLMTFHWVRPNSQS